MTARPELRATDAMSSRPLGRPAVRALGVRRTFTAGRGKAVHALGPLDLEIEEGEFVCIVGPSGCGKSTFLRSVAGLLAPTSGSIEVALRRPRRTAIAMVFQDYGIYPWQTVASNVQFGLKLERVGKAETKRRVAEWLDRLGLAEFADAYPSTLSGGMRQRVAIARALAVEPELLLMDEPFAALDAQLREVLQEQLLALWQADRRTVLFVTHSLEEALVLADRVVVMSSRPGRIVESVKVPFERPRTGGLRSQPRFGEVRAHLWEQLRTEIEPTVTVRAGAV
jgi:NitT/TauT family transport system ATP-binding protein